MRIHGHNGAQPQVVHPTVAELCEGIQSAVSSQLAMARQTLARNHERCLNNMSMHVADVRHKVERQVGDLQQENQKLREELKKARSMACNRPPNSPNFSLPGDVGVSDETSLQPKAVSRSSPNSTSTHFGHDLASVPVPVLLLSRLTPPRPVSKCRMREVSSSKLCSDDGGSVLITPGGFDIPRPRSREAFQVHVPMTDGDGAPPPRLELCQVEPFGHVENPPQNSSGDESSTAELGTLPFKVRGKDATGAKKPRATGWKSRPFRNSVSSDITPSSRHKAPATNKVFADADAMKQKVRLAIGELPYNVTEHYKSTGCAQRIAKSHLFDSITLIIIGVNALWIAVDTDLNRDSDNTHPIFLIASNFFCVYFSVEWLIRFAAFQRKRNIFRDRCFIFDSFLLVLMILETWILGALVFRRTDGHEHGDGFKKSSTLRLLKLMRLTRVARMVRILRAVPELMILIKGMFVAARSVLFTLSLLLVVVYVFAIAFVEVTDGTDVGKSYFDSVPSAVNSLILHGTLLEECPRVANELGAISLGHILLFYLFILVASLTVMNMLVGILVEVVKVVSLVEKEQLQVNWVKDRLCAVTGHFRLDDGGEAQISKAEFEVLIQKPEAAKALHDVGVDVVGLVDFVDFLFKNDEDISFASFMETVLSLRGTNGATVKDVVDLRKCMMVEFARHETDTDCILEALQAIRNGEKL